MEDNRTKTVVTALGGFVLGVIVVMFNDDGSTYDDDSRGKESLS